MVLVRVETEHLGNADAYRVTREIPLPYRRVGNESSEDEHVSLVRAQSRRTVKGKSLSGQFERMRSNLALKRSRAGKPARQDTILDPPASRSPEEPRDGMRGSARPRDYEAWRSDEGEQSSGSGDTVDLESQRARQDGAASGSRQDGDQAPSREEV